MWKSIVQSAWRKNQFSIGKSLCPFVSIVLFECWIFYGTKPYRTTCLMEDFTLILRFSFCCLLSLSNLWIPNRLCLQVTITDRWRVSTHNAFKCCSESLSPACIARKGSQQGQSAWKMNTMTRFIVLFEALCSASLLVIPLLMNKKLSDKRYLPQWRF